MTSDFEKQLMYDRRLCVLRLLYDYGGSANDSVIKAGLEALGHRFSHQALLDDLRFLNANGCIASDYVGTIQIVEITKRGADVSKGHTEIEGVKRPSIGV